MEHNEIKDNTSLNDNCNIALPPSIGNIDSEDEDVPIRFSALGLPKASCINSSSTEVVGASIAGGKRSPSVFLPISISFAGVGVKFVEDPKQEVDGFELAISELRTKPKLIIPGKHLGDSEEEYITESSLIELQTEPSFSLAPYKSAPKHFNLLKGKLLTPSKPIQDLSKRGEVEVRTSRVLSKWKARYCSIECSQCLIFRSEDDELLRAVVNFRQFPAKVERKGKLAFR